MKCRRQRHQVEFDLPTRFGGGVDPRALPGDRHRVSHATQAQGLIRLGKVATGVGKVAVDLLLRLGQPATHLHQPAFQSRPPAHGKLQLHLVHWIQFSGRHTIDTRP